jgi:hypothetical protein
VTKDFDEKRKVIHARENSGEEEEEKHANGESCHAV